MFVFFGFASRRRAKEQKPFALGQRIQYFVKEKDMDEQELNLTSA